MSGYENNVFGTFNYLAPEIYLNERRKRHRSSSDIWSFGITLYEIIFGSLPFTNSKGDEFIDRKKVEDYFRGRGEKINYDAD